MLSLAGYTLSYADTTITGIDKSVVSFTVTGLTAQTTYTFTLKAVNADGLESESATFNVTTPAVPTNLKAGLQSSSAVRLQWTASSTDNGQADFDGY